MPKGDVVSVLYGLEKYIGFREGREDGHFTQLGRKAGKGS